VNEQEFAQLAAGHALNALSTADLRTFAQARAAHPEWEHMVQADAATAAALVDAADPVTPPAEIRAELLAQITLTPQDSVPPRTRAEARARTVVDETAVAEPAVATAPRRRFGTRAWFALAASMALLVGVGWGAVFVSEQLSTPASVVALQQIQDAPDAQSASATLADGGEATAYWSESLGKSVLVSDGLPTLAEDQSFEMWFVRDGEAVSAGTFAADEGTATALLAGDVEPGDVIAVTVEATGGSKTGQPTTDPIVAIPTA
jgi:anti-sigma-K factor RskA